MGFMDFLNSIMGGADDTGGQMTGNILGNIGDGLGIASAFTKNEKTAAGLGMGSGIASMANNSIGLLAAGKNLKEGNKEDAGWGFAESGLGMLGGIADTISGAYGLKGDKASAKKATAASGVFGALGGLVSGAHGIRGLMTANNADEKRDAWMSIASGAAGLFSGITNIGSGLAKEGSDAEGRWETAGKVSAIAGAIPGLLGTFFGAKDALSGGSGGGGA